MSKKIAMPSEYYLNRELSWLEFNRRVLSEAHRSEKPLLERLKFLTISATNLDEFFQVRVGGLTLLKSAGTRSKDISGLTPHQQLVAIRKKTANHIDDQYLLYNDVLLPELKQNGIHICAPNQVEREILLELKDRFLDEIAPLLTPIAYCDRLECF